MIQALGPDQQQLHQQPPQQQLLHTSGNALPGGNFIAGMSMGSRSTPGSPQEQNRPNSFEVIGSAESLVGRVSTTPLRLYPISNPNLFSFSRVFVGACRTRLRKVLWSWFYTLYITRNAGSSRYDKRRNGFGSTSINAAKSCYCIRINNQSSQ